MQAVTKGVHILSTLLLTQRKYKKDYSYPAQKTAISNMETYQGLKISRSTYNRWTRVLEDAKYLVRRRRIKRHPRYGLMFKSTLYKITIKGLRLLSRFGVDMRKEIAQYEKWLEEINPELKNERIKKELAAADRNDRHKEFMDGIVEKLDKIIVAP